MSEFDWIMVVLTTMSVLALPILVFLIRGAIKWTKVEMKLEELIRDEREAHTEMYRTMREDRKATDERLRWLEVNVWMRGRPRGNS